MTVIAIIAIILINRLITVFFISKGSFVVNKGVALGVIGGWGVTQYIYVPIVAFLLYILWKRFGIKRVPLVLITAGSISNLLDRLLYNGVVDYINIWLLPVFNLADVMLVAGILMLIYFEIKNYARKSNSNKRI